MFDKFRAFREEEMVYNAVRLRNVLHWEDAGGARFDLLAFVQYTPAILMQYTGLRDRNDVEIYEDDIVAKFALQEPYFRAVVKRHLGAFGYIGVGEEFITFAGNCHFDWVGGKSMKIEVLGNIHENPEIEYLVDGEYVGTC